MAVQTYNPTEVSSSNYELGNVHDRKYPVLRSSLGLTLQDSGTYLSRTQVVYERVMTKIGAVFFPIGDITHDKAITRDEVNVPEDLEELVFQLA